jgi:hypothetical protein
MTLGGTDPGSGGSVSHPIRGTHNDSPDYVIARSAATKQSLIENKLMPNLPNDFIDLIPQELCLQNGAHNHVLEGSDRIRPGDSCG